MAEALAEFLRSPALESPQWLEQALHGPLSRAGLPKLASVAHIAVATCVSSFALQKLSSVVCPVLFPKTYPPRSLQRKRDDWDLHVVGWAFAIIAAPLAFSMIMNPSPEIVKDRVYGYGLAEGRLSAFATGYFVWDAFVSAKHVSTQGLGFLAHGAGCCLAFLFTLKPFLMFCCPDFLIWELSTIFLNAHWYLDKFGMTGSTAQLINGVFLIASYIGARLVWGLYNSYKLYFTLFAPDASSHVGNIRFLYAGLNVLMNGLNLFWFRAMVLALKKRFIKADPSARREVIEVNGKLSWNDKKKKN